MGSGLARSSASQTSLGKTRPPPGVARRAARSGRAHPPPPFLETKNQLRPLPKMRAFFHSGEVLRCNAVHKELYGTAAADSSRANKTIVSDSAPSSTSRTNARRSPPSCVTLMGRGGHVAPIAVEVCRKAASRHCRYHWQVRTAQRYLKDEFSASLTCEMAITVYYACIVGGVLARRGA